MPTWAGRVNICFKFYMSFNIVNEDPFMRMLLRRPSRNLKLTLVS